MHILRQKDDKTPLPSWAVDIPEYFSCTRSEIPPEALARELTLIDKELFLMIHESELVDCMWMKHDKHSKAPNVLKAIEFFERVVRSVSADILKRNYDWARAMTMAYYTTVASKCLELQNFHSLKAILCGMQVPAIYRLKHSWEDFEEIHPEQYNLFMALAHLMADDGCSDDYFSCLEKAEKNPPYLPFLGAFLKSLFSLFTVEDMGGMRTQHRVIKSELEVDNEYVCSHSDNDIVQDRHQSAAYLLSETLFHYQIAAIQYKWIDLPPVRAFWLRNQLADEVGIWKKSCKKEDGSKNREGTMIRLAKRKQVEEAYRNRMERLKTRRKLAEEAAIASEYIES